MNSSNNSKNLRNVTYPALMEKYGPGAKYQWVSPQSNGKHGHFRYTRSNGSKNNVGFNASKQIAKFGLSASDLSAAFAGVSGLGNTTIDLPDLPVGSPFGWSHEENMWIYKNPATGAFFTSQFVPLSGGRRKRQTRRH